MYDYLKGKLDSIQEDYLVVDMNGVGYKVFTSQNTIRNISVDSTVKIFTQLIVKEDDLVIYGFDTRDELHMFKLLNTVSGVGPKAAVSLLNHYKSQEIALAIVSKDAVKLTKAQGIGKKTAERIILELKDKIDTESAIAVHNVDSFGGDITQVIEALTSLGYNYSVAAQAAAKLKNQEAPIDQMIKEALRILAVM
ncbi:MAG: Holliday junction DNA helicase RuvA [Clostridiales bacterium GWB2_37_7]|nr:MAG: Holliday junction DNA helicase RuvA [Clostridiales bacterium GWB2_37_7]